MYQIIFMNGLISSLATSSKAQQLSKHSTSSITARMKVALSSTFTVLLNLRIVATYFIVQC